MEPLDALHAGKSWWKLSCNYSPCSAVPGDYSARLNEINIGMIFSFHTQTVLESKENSGFHIGRRAARCTPCCPGCVRLF